MPRPTDICSKATRETRAKGGRARAEKLAAEREEERRLLAELRRDRLDVAIRRLAEAAERAAATIEELLGAKSEGVRLRAALGCCRCSTWRRPPSSPRGLSGSRQR